MSMRIGPSLAIGGYDKIPFQPQSLGSALIAWWDPDYGITKDPVSFRITNWLDRVANTDAMQNVGSFQPLYVASEPNMNNRACIEYTTQPLVLNLTLPAPMRVQQQKNTYLAVIRGTGDVLNSGATSVGSFLLTIASSKVQANTRFTSGTVTQSGLTTVSATSRLLVGQMNDGVNIYPLLNGVKDNVGAAVGTPATPSTSFRIGYRGNNASSFLGYFGDVFIFQRDLTDAELTQMYLWAKERWAL